MPERSDTRDDGTVAHQPPPELTREPHAGSPDAPGARDVDRADGADGADDHKNHDPYQPL